MNVEIENKMLQKLVNLGRILYVELTNCERYTDGGDEVAGHYCPNNLLEKFDYLYCAENMQLAGLQASDDELIVVNVDKNFMEALQGFMERENQTMEFIVKQALRHYQRIREPVTEPLMMKDIPHDNYVKSMLDEGELITDTLANIDKRGGEQL